MSGDSRTRASVSRRTLIISATTALVIAVLAIWLAVSATGGDAPTAEADGAQATPSPTATVTATPAPAAAATPIGELKDDEALEVVETALAAPIASVSTPEDLDALLTDIAVDAYAEELAAQWQELISQGWTITGAPALVSAEVTSIDAKTEPSTAEVTACVDSTEVEILDASGTRIGSADATTPRALHLFSLVQDDEGTWRISAHRFPNDPIC